MEPRDAKHGANLARREQEREFQDSNMTRQQAQVAADWQAHWLDDEGNSKFDSNGNLKPEHYGDSPDNYAYKIWDNVLAGKPPKLTPSQQRAGGDVSEPKLAAKAKDELVVSVDEEGEKFVSFH